MRPEPLPKMDNQTLADLLVMQWTSGTLAEYSAGADKAAEQIKELLDNKDKEMEAQLSEAKRVEGILVSALSTIPWHDVTEIIFSRGRANYENICKIRDAIALVKRGEEKDK